MMAKVQAAAKTINSSGESRVAVRMLVALVLPALVAAGCGSVEQSLEAGSETSATTTALTTTDVETSTTAAEVTTTVATSTSTSTSTAAATTTFAEDSFIGLRTDSDDSYRVDVSLEDLLSIETLRFVSGPVVGVETGPTHKWETDPDTGREDRIDVPFDSPEAMSQMLHIEIAPRHLAGPDLSEFGETVVIGMQAPPAASASAVFDELSALGDLAFFLIKSPVTDYRADLWSDLLDGEAIGLVEADRSVNFPSYAMRAVQIDNVDTFVENVLADAGFETRSTALPDAGEVDTNDESSEATATTVAPTTSEAPATTVAPTTSEATATTAAPDPSCEERNRTTPPDWDGAPINQSLYHSQHGYIAEVPRASTNFYPTACFDNSAQVPVCTILWNLDDPAGAVAYAVRRIDNNETVVTLDTPPESWTEAAASFPAECFQE